MYVNPRTLSDAFGVSTSTLRRWSDSGILKAGRTAGGHRRYTISEAVNLARTQKISIKNPALLGLPESLPPSGDSSNVQINQLMEALDKDDFQPVRDLILGSYISGTSLVDLFSDLIVPVLAKLGMEWEYIGDSVIAKEHAFTQVLLESLGALKTLIKPPVSMNFAAGGSPPGDPYRIPTTLVSLTLQDMGFQAINLGPDYPLESFLDYANKHRPKLMWLSVTSESTVPLVKRKIYPLAEALKEIDVLLVVGGRHALRITRKPIENVVGFHSLDNFCQFIKGMNQGIKR